MVSEDLFQIEVWKSVKSFTYFKIFKLISWGKIPAGTPQSIYSEVPKRFVPKIVPFSRKTFEPLALPVVFLQPATFYYFKCVCTKTEPKLQSMFRSSVPSGFFAGSPLVSKLPKLQFFCCTSTR